MGRDPSNKKNNEQENGAIRTAINRQAMIQKLDREKIIEEMSVWGNLSHIGVVVAKVNQIIDAINAMQAPGKGPDTDGSKHENGGSDNAYRKGVEDAIAEIPDILANSVDLKPLKESIRARLLGDRGEN